MSPFIPTKEKEQVSKILANMDREVHVTVLTQPTSTLTIPGTSLHSYKETLELATEVATLTSKIKLNVIDVIAHPEKLAEHRMTEPPAIVLSRNRQVNNLRFFGAPPGYEFSSFIQSLLLFSGASPDLPKEFSQEVQELASPLHLEVFVTPT